MWHPFILELAERAWPRFLSAIGTTGLGLFVNTIEEFAATLLVTHIAIWALRGTAAMKEHAAQNITIAIVVFVIVLPILYGPIYYHQISLERERIIEESGTIPVPNNPTKLMPSPPSWAYDLSAPSIILSLKSIGFTFMNGLEPGQTYNLADKREYELAILNEREAAAHSATLTFQFPRPWVVIGSRIVEQTNVSDARFQPSTQFTAFGNGSVRTNGCSATSSYVFTAALIGRRGRAMLRFVIEKYAPPFPEPSLPQEPPSDFVWGKFTYRHRETLEGSEFYSQLTSDGNNIALMPTPPSSVPDVLGTRRDMMVVPPPCIPSGAL